MTIGQLLLVWLAEIIAVAVLVYLYGRWRATRDAVRVFSSWSAVVATDVPQAIRVVAFNIAHGRGLARSNFGGGSFAVRMARLNAIADFLHTTAADVVVLNEVDFAACWSKNFDQAKYLAGAAGYPFYATQRNFDVRLPLVWLQFGNAVLSRWPIAAARLVDLPPRARWEARLAGHKRAVEVTLQLPDRLIRVVAVHLEHRDELSRIAAAEQIIRELTKVPAPVIVAGDFNSQPPDFRHAERDAAGRTALQTFIEASFRPHAIETTIEPTWDTDRRADFLSARLPRVDATATSDEQTGGRIGNPPYGSARLDWVLVRGGSVKSEHVPTVNLSDHRPVVAEVVL